MFGIPGALYHRSPKAPNRLKGVIKKPRGPSPFWKAQGEDEKEMAEAEAAFGIPRSPGHPVSYTHLTLPTKRIV